MAAPARAPGGRIPLLPLGTVVWLASEVTFFGSLFGAYFTLRSAASGPWPPADVELETALTGLATLLLVASSGTMQLGVRAIASGDRVRFRRLVVLTAFLAVVFLANQAREWSVAGFGPSSHAYGSAFFVMTGFHGLHVAGGVVGMAVMLGQSADAAFGAESTDAVEVLSYYWHFVDVVWLLMFTTLFLFP
ncbi:MAG: cytochrome c oxidase subunit 3 [Acidimicrobiia bacterium]